MQWLILNGITGNPMLSLVLLMCLGWIADRFTLGLLPNPIRALLRWKRATTLENQIHINPHDRRARFELADLLIHQRRCAAAVEVLKPNLVAGDDDAATLFLMGVACFGSNHPNEGEVFLTEARKSEPNYRGGDIELELGRGFLGAARFAEAAVHLRSYLENHPGSVETRVLLARALEHTEGHVSASRLREEAWDAYRTAPIFQRRRERLWAWRVRPGRPLAYAAVAAALGFALFHWLEPTRRPTSPFRSASMAAPGYRTDELTPE